MYQATEFNCGAIIISCAILHQVGDAYSLHMFLVAWAKYAQSETITNVPSIRPSILNPRHPPCYNTSIDNLYMPMSSLPPPSSFEEPLQGRIYYIHAESIKRLQSEASTEETKRSKFLSFTAFLWKLLAHEGDTASNAASRMGIGVHRFVAPAAKEEHFRQLIDWVELHRPNPMVARIYFGLEGSEGKAVVVSDGHGLPIKDMDFGWGKPEFGSYHFPWGGQTGYGGLLLRRPTSEPSDNWSGVRSSMNAGFGWCAYFTGKRGYERRVADSFVSDVGGRGCASCLRWGWHHGPFPSKERFSGTKAG
ncbi:hypothetical protein L1887_38640 [Cichorium endivia]|nr:hypothetical protein L1887_38640 [Cichorium endivia]